MFRPSEIGQIILDRAHFDTIRHRADQGAEIAADTILVNHREAALAIPVKHPKASSIKKSNYLYGSS